MTATEEEARSMQTLGELLSKSNNVIINSASALPKSLGITLPPQQHDDNNDNATDKAVGNTDDIDAALDSVKDALATLGVISGAKDQTKVWQRPIPSSLFQPPRYNPSLTTLMPTSRLPPGAKIRGGNSNNIEDDNKDVDDDELVEVWKYSLTTSDGGENSSNDLHQRPLQGNLSSKLGEHEYLCYFLI